MSDLTAYFSIALGVLVAVLYPVLLGKVRGAFPATKGRIPPWATKYLVLLIFCLVTSLIILAYFRSSHPDTQLGFWAALVMGFAWESSIEKVFSPPKGPQQPPRNP